MSTYGMRHSNGSQPTYSERVCLKQVEPHAVDLLTENFGGYRFIAKPSAKRGRPLHGWQVTDKKAATFLAAVRPYLRIKIRQAENCLALREVKERSKSARVAKGRGHVGSAKRPADLGAEMDRLHATAKRLNKVGA